MVSSVPWEDILAVIVNVPCAPPLPLSCSVIVLSPVLREVVGMRSGREPSNNGIDGGGTNTQNKR